MHTNHLIIIFCTSLASTAHCNLSAVSLAHRRAPAASPSFDPSTLSRSLLQRSSPSSSSCPSPSSLDLLEESLHASSIPSPYEFPDRLPISESHYCWQCSDFKVRGELKLLVRVDRHQIDIRLGRDLSLEHRRKLLTRPAPVPAKDELKLQPAKELQKLANRRRSPPRWFGER